MKRFKNILVIHRGAVGDDDALTQATMLASRNGAQLTLLEVFDDGSVSPSRRIESEKNLNRLAASVAREGTPAKAVVRVGTPFLRIIQEVLDNDHDLVVTSAERHGGFKELFFGNTSMHLMRKCPCPVWVVKPHQDVRYSRILAAVDPGPTDAGVDELNGKIMELASSLARLNGSELDVVHAWDLTGADLDTSRSEISDEIRDRLMKRNSSLYQQRLDALVGHFDLSDISHHLHLVRGDPTTAIPELAHEQSVDLIVMGSLNHSGIAGMFIGKTAELVLRQVSCAVLTVKPEQFVSPVTQQKFFVAGGTQGAARSRGSIEANL